MTNSLIKLSLLSGIVVFSGGCFFGRDDSIRCEDPSLYGSSRSVPPVRVPDGLDVPDETGALQIPPGESLVIVDEELITECLESPPDFFEENAENPPPQ